MAWGADIKYYIINNQGKVCFQYVIQDAVNYTSIDKTKLCVHPWARSMVAKDFRFYTERADAVLDAGGAIGSHFVEGDVISEVAPGTTTFYVRYSLKNEDDLAAEGFVDLQYDNNGSMTYLVQIRERNGSNKNAKRRQVYFDAATADQRFEVGSPGSNRTDIPDPDPAVEGGGAGNLQTALPYRFRFVPNGDPYGVYIYNGAGEGGNPNGVLTVQGVGSSGDNDTKHKERVSYEDIISNYDPENTTTLQTFFFVGPNNYILNDNWSNDSWTGKVFIVGALGGIDYYMRDKNNRLTGNEENHLPYMLCANGDPNKSGAFTDGDYPNGYQLQCYRSWRNMDPSIDNTALIKTTPFESVHEVTYHIVNSANTSEDVLTIVQRHGQHSPFNLSKRDKLQRLGCTLSTDYYSDRECTTSASALVGDSTDVYIPYTFDAAGTTSATNLVFSTEEDPVWFSMDIRESGIKLLTYDTTNNVIDSRYAPTDANRLKQESQYAFIGDPYSFRIICKGADGKYAYVDTETINVYGANEADNVRFTETPTSNMDCWAMVPGTTSNSFQIFQRDAFRLNYRAFWDARNNGNEIRMLAQTSGDEIRTTSNLHVTPTPTYSYTYNIVDNTGSIAIKYTVTQDVSRSLVGEHGHKAIPSAIYSSYLEGETLTFYTTFTTPGDTTTLSGEIDKLPSGNTDIYVRYTTALLSSRPYPLDGTKSYFMQIGPSSDPATDRYVIYNSGVTTQVGRPSIDEVGKESKIWIIENGDPYNVRVRNSGHSYNLFDDGSDIHLIVMGGAGTAEGQIELIFGTATGEATLDATTPGNRNSLTLSGSAVIKDHTNHGSDNQQIIFIEAVLERTYRLIDKQGKILLEYQSTELETGETGYLGVPEKWRSPLIDYTARENCGYKYWVRSNFNVSGDTYTLKENQTNITSPTESNDGYIYVTYDANSLVSLSQVDPTKRSHRDNDPAARLVRKAEDFGQIYMIQFKNGQDFYQESGDSLQHTKMKAIYPYANGDSGFNIYGEEKWESDKQSGSSTRTRWSWFLVSEKNDPYHVVITSWQFSHPPETNVATAYYNYWRTYYNSTIGAITTGTITDDPQVIDTSVSGGSVDNVATEYMVLGTANNYKLLTVNEIDGGVAPDATYGKRRFVRTFQQYWKTYETISRKGKLPWDVFKKKSEDSNSFFTDDNVAANPVYRYQAWHNSRPIDPDNPTAQKGKVYAYDWHYYQTIDLGETFDLVEHSIDGILILLDNHGWEIMRHPMAKTGAANKAVRDADIRQFDSPMVKQYHFYQNATKKIGYHKYYDIRTEKGTGTSLADYPEVLNTNMNQVDMYVTYDVKPEFEEAYIGSDSEHADEAGTVQYPFLIRQDGKLAQASNATTLITIESSSTGVDSGSTTGLTDDNLYWYLKPNFDIDKELGYKYKGEPNAETEADTKSNTEKEYINKAFFSNGFDPYNIQIYNKQYPTGYFTTSATAAALDGHGGWGTTDAAKTVSLAANNSPVATTNGTSYDGLPVYMTNQTFMAIQDANGNMRLMPRFDHAHVMQNFTTLAEPAVAQPEDDKVHGQTTWLLRPTIYTYIVVDSLGREALRYTLLSDGSPKIPAMFRSPLAKDFTFWKTLSAGATNDYDLETLADRITGSFADASLSAGGTVYVRYHYDSDADTDGLLKGTWYNAKLNNDDVKVTTGGIVKETFSADNTHRWRFMQSAGDIRDPYAVTLWNGTPATESSGNRYVLMKHSDGTGYALMQAGTKTAASYSFLDGSSSPILAAQTNYTTTGTIDATKKLTLTPVVAANNIIYKIITASGRVALSSDSIAVTDESVLSLPEWMESPLMKSDAYIFYSAADVVGTTYTIKGESTTTPTTLDTDVVYVRYDYEKSKQAVTSFGTEMEEAHRNAFDGLPYNYAPLDLSGKVAYTMGTISYADYRGKLWSVNSDATIKQDKVTVNTELTKEARLWYFTGNDPYEVTIKNPAHSTTKVLAGKEPNLAADWNTTPNDKYPLVKMVEPDDGTYELNTFMVLKYNPNEVTEKANNIEHCAGTLKLYITGHDNQYLAESNSLAGGIYIYTDEQSYKDRLAAEGEPINPIVNNPRWIVFSSFFYRPVMTYHIITNAGQNALTGYSLMDNTTVEMPEVYQSPLLHSSDFSYYTAATNDGGTWTVTESSKTAASTSIASLAAKSIGEIYVRYKYDPATSPFRIATSIDDDADDGTRLSWINETNLDLNGRTWYTIANMQRNFSTEHGRVFGAKSETTFETLPVDTLTNGRAPSNKEYLWRLEGNDPYAIKIYNAQHQKYLSVADNSSRTMNLLSDGAEGNTQTFMLLEAHAVDNQVSRLSGYELSRWTVLMTTGTNYFTPCTTTGSGATSALTARGTWTAANYSEYQIRMSSDKVVTRKIYSMGGGSTTPYCIEFVKAPVSRKYHYHAIQYDGSGNKVGQTWHAILEHDWLQDLVLDEVMARQYCKYETRSTTFYGSGDVNVTPTNEFVNRFTINDTIQFYHNAELTERVLDTNSGKFDIYPEIELDDVYDIYFKYQIDNNATLSGRTLAGMSSTPEQIAADVAYYGANERMDNTYTQQAKWFFMVLDTDVDITATGTGDERTFVGNQYFLRREDDGTVSWMNNAYTLHKYEEDNYNDWSYSRIAEWYRKGDNDAYREGRWLWTFVGDDPYNMRIINFESAVGVTAEGYNVYNLAGAENCYTTISKITTDTGADIYPVVIPTSEPTENQYWGICVGVNKSPEETFSLLSTSITENVDEITVNTPLYWHMVSRTANKVTTESVEGLIDYIPGRTYAIQLLPYEPVKYQDINLVIKRDDHVDHYKNTWKPANPSATDDQKKTQLKSYDSGISLLYFTAAERTYVEGDQIDLRDMESLPINLRRAFCSYKLYRDDYSTLPTNETPYYIVTDGPYPTTTQATTNGTWSNTAPYVYTPSGDLLYDEDGKPVWTYVNADGTPAAGAQSIYIEYEVTSDIFLKTAPTASEVATMVANNDHVYFMDFPTIDSKGKTITHHAFYDPEATTRIQTGDLSKNKDKNTGRWIPEKKTWDDSSSAFVSNTSDAYNNLQYRTDKDRMVSTPEKLKWYFVGDPYKVQVFSTAGPWNAASMTDPNSTVWADSTKAAQLARFNAVETNFQFVSDCVHIRLPDYTKIDNRSTLIPTDEYGVSMPDKAFPNRNNGKPYINDFYWEVMPSASDVTGAFSLRFKEDNELLGYRNVYYYLAHDGLTKTYRSQSDTPEVYHINLSYNADNERYESGTHLGYHKANNENTAIKLVQPVKVYITTHRRADTRYSLKSEVTKDEYSGYYGLGETITGVPRHLQRKYVSYADLTDKFDATMGEHVLSEGNAENSPLPTCSAHSSNVFVTGTKVNPIFKFSVFYTVDDLTSDGVNLFTPAANPTAPTVAELNDITWLDMKISDSSWPYYDKTNTDGGSPAVENKTDFVSNYRRAMYDPKNGGWNNDADGWNDGLKGLHWAFIGDPYDFTILNRRRYEDGTYGTDPMWLGATKRQIDNWQTPAVNDSIVWTACLVNAPTATNTSTATAALANGSGQNTHWSLQMWKTGGDSDFFLRTASLNQAAYDGSPSADTETDKYWRMVARNTTIGGDSYEFECIPYSLDNKNKWTSNVGNLTYNNYVTNGMGYSKTSSGMGIKEQLIQIRTATAKDNDKADNNCFDARVEIRSKNGDLRISKDNMEIKYGIAADMLPYSLRRYGCIYECYLGYTNPENPGTLLYRLRDSNVPMEEGESYSTSTAEFEALRAAINASNATLTFVYDVDEEVAPYFTTESNALIDEYTWMNTYFEWEQYYSGTNVEVEYYEDVFDHYVYNAQGQIIDAVYVKERRTKIEKNPTTPYITDAFINSHSTSTSIYADQSVQTEDDRQKWALVGDPYSFTMVNYDQYLKNENSKLARDGNDVVASNVDKQNFTIAVDADGNTFLGIFDGTGVDGGADITHCINFDYSASSDKTLHSETSAVINDNDPTGNTLKTTNIKPFKLADLISYADVLQYHLVIAHQHTLDPSDTHLQNLGSTDTGTAKEMSDRKVLRDHLVEFLKYKGIRSHSDSTYYVNYAASPVFYSTAHATEEDFMKMLKENGTLRDFISYPINDYNVSRVGIGNHPQVPWYMKRQFCKYHLYQRDVMRSKVSDRPAFLKNDNGEYVDYEGNVVDEVEAIPLYMDEDKLIRAYEIDWVSIFDVSTWNVWQESDGNDAKYTVTAADVTKWGNGLVAGTYRKIPSGLAEAQDLQGEVLTTLKSCHKNRKVIIDVVYEVNTEEFQFATSGRNTYAWYQMMTNNASSGLMNFSYKDGVGARTDRATHYTNNYLWAPEGDPYGFVMRSRYATINGTGWNDVAVTTTGHLPKKADYTSYDQATIIAGDANAYNATYTNSVGNSGGNLFDNKLIIHHLGGEELATNDGAANAIYEMFTGDASFTNSFMMHPTSAYIDLTNTDFVSYYMMHDTGTNKAKLVSSSAKLLKNDADANWRLATTAEQLWPYFENAGYVGGLDPVKAQNFSNMELHTQLKEYIDNPSMEREYSVLNKARQLVYKGNFYKRNGVELLADEARPTAAAELPVRFVPENLVPMTAGYYRIQGFSTDELSAAEGVSGVSGPRYVSGYRFDSEVTNTKPLRYFETNQESTTIHTFADLTSAKSFSDATPGTDVLQGNIELLPAEYDASSIFQFVATGDDFDRWTFGSQDLHVQVDGTTTKMSSAAGTPFRLDDIGGATVTLRTLAGEPSNADDSHTWDSDPDYNISKNIQTNYLTSDGDSYSLSVAANNELNQTETTEIQDTKWRLQPIGIKTDWPYNQMPLRVEVKKGGVDKNGAEDKYYYGSLCVPFDSRLGNTTDAAFTMVREITGTEGTITMPSVSQYNGMGNPQYVPATWPVVMRTNKPGVWTEGSKHYVDMYLPYTAPQTVSKADLNDKLKGEYLERTLNNTYMDGVESKTIMVFGLPFESHATDHHVYDNTKRVGFFVNDNWARETHPTGYNANTATDAQRNNKYVYHNKVYYVLETASPVREYVIALFDDEEEPEDEPIQETVTKKNVPWPCRVYDLQGRLIADYETPQTLLKNYPSLQPGVYIFGDRKVVVK